VPGGFHQMSSCPTRAPGHPASSAASCPNRSLNTTDAMVRSHFHYLGICGMECKTFVLE